MELNNTRIFLIISLALVGALLYGSWVKEKTPQPSQTAATQAVSTPIAANNIDIPSSNNTTNTLPAATNAAESNAVIADRLITVETDVFLIKIDKVGGDIVECSLKQYPITQAKDSPGFQLLSLSKQKNYIAQSGLIEEMGPDSSKGRAHYVSQSNQFVLTSQKDQTNPATLNVDLMWNNGQGITVTKTYTFHPSKYLIDVNYHIVNHSSKPFSGKMYGQLRQLPPKSTSGMLSMQMYRGGAAFTPDKPYKKLSFDKIAKTPFTQTIQGGWVAMVEHYFLASYIPNKNTENSYYGNEKEGNYYLGALTDVAVPPSNENTVGGQFYLGPEIKDVLKPISPGLDLTIDYGILWPISQLLFWLLKNIYQFVGNWGWSIILVTLMIKLAFYKLSASSYRSMGHMRRIQPKIQALKERLGDNRQEFGKAMMELYRKEKINPLGGCLPILIQIPVFIALYYVLLESVELRHAPFMLWIQDLSSKDPYYVLPIIMGITMFVQQRMSPQPPDPMQAKIMMFMPVVFTVLFVQFPSGLVLYWVANNILSMLQQYYITLRLEKEGLPRPSRK